MLPSMEIFSPMTVFDSGKIALGIDSLNVSSFGVLFNMFPPYEEIRVFFLHIILSLIEIVQLLAKLSAS
jgi:hypothetical protein